MGTIIEILFLLVIVLIIISNLLIRSLYKNLKNEKNETELSGFEIARKISNKLAQEEPHIIKKNGKFIDYYDINRNVIKLSPEVFDGTDIYSSIIALNTALETEKGKENIAKGHNLSSFIVIASYIMICIGAVLNNFNIIHFGLILFILSFILELLILNLYAKTKEDVNELYEFIKMAEVIKPFEEYKDYIIILLLTSIARLPYGFINKFR